jgi:hypothetical protein
MLTPTGSDVTAIRTGVSMDDIAPGSGGVRIRRAATRDA